MQPRSYQLECLDRVMAENTIVNMPTGTGKTLIAVLAIDRFRHAGKVIFLVPTRPLVTQQAEYVRSHANQTVVVKELQGSQTDHFSASEWQDIVRCSDVLVGTAEVFRRALVDTKFLSLSTFSLLIFDECHNAVGNSPMAAIMRDSVHRLRDKPPRILGLTASFVHGSLRDIEKKRKDLEGLLQARIFCPDVDERPMEFERIFYAQSVQPEMEQLVEAKVQTLLGLAEQNGVPIKDFKSVVRRGVHVFSELGLAAFIYFLRECVAPQVQSHIEQMTEVLPSGYRDGPRQALQNIPRLRQAMGDAAERLASDGSLTAFPYITDKASKLLELIQSLQTGSASTRIIVFCEQTVLAHPMAHLLQHHTGCQTGTCTGVGSMTDGQRKKALKSFRGGEVPLLTCTAALEEGLDVSECEVVVRFSQFQTTKSHIQGSGRARAWNARVFYFDNDPGKELAGADLMERTAKQLSLSLSSAEMQAKREHTDVQGVHPYRTNSEAEISIFNCVQMVYEFAQRALGASFRPEEGMLHYKDEIVCEFPLQRRKTLTAVTVPSPDGFFEIGQDTVNTWWGECDIDDVAEKSRMKNWDSSDRELRRFIFVVAVVLSQRGYLDSNNQPSARSLRETRHVCEAWKMSSGARIGVRYDPQGLAMPARESQQAAAATSSSLHPQRISAEGTRAALLSSTSEGHQIVHSRSQPTENYKGQLNETTNSGAVYNTVPEAGGFRSTVLLPDGRSFQGAVAQNKKAAEQSAAKEALNFSGQRLLSPQPNSQQHALAGRAANVRVAQAAYSAPRCPAQGSDSMDLASSVLAHLLQREVVELAELVRECGATKQDVNRALYNLQRRGLARKVVDAPPVWAAIS